MQQFRSEADGKRAGGKGASYCMPKHPSILLTKTVYWFVFVWLDHAFSSGYGGSLGRYLMEKGADSSIRNRVGLVSLCFACFGAYVGGDKLDLGDGFEYDVGPELMRET